MPYKPRTCPYCGDALDPGEICKCREKKEEEPPKEDKPSVAGALEGAEAAAYREAVAEKVTITLEKAPGVETFHRRIEASSSSAALNGVAVLIRELAEVLGVPVTKVLALLAVVLTVPTIRATQNEGQGA